MPSTAEQRKARALKKPDKKEGGNCGPDAAWFAEIDAAGQFQAPDVSQRPEGFLYDINYQWTGYADEVNVEFFLAFARGERRCTGTAYIRDASGQYIVDAEWERLTRPCLRSPGKGTVVCTSHGSKIPQVRAAAERRLAEAADVVAARLINLTDVADEHRLPIDPSVRVKAANSVLDRAGIKGGVDVEVQLPGYKKALADLFGVDASEDSASERG